MKIKKKIATLLAVLILLTAMPLLGGTKIYDEKMIAAESIATALFEEATDGVSQVVYSYDLRGLDGEKDFILVTGQYSGYAIFTREDLSLIEYSPYGSSPYSGLDKSQSRYAGPASYYVEEGTGVKNINTKEIVKKENLTVIADKVRTKSSIGTVELPVVKEEVSTMSMGGVSTMSAGAGGAEAKAPNEYPIVSKKLISDYEYFLAFPDRGYNGSTVCTVVATQLLLSYNNWSKFGLLITEPNFLSRNSNDYLKPYSKEYMSTTSQNNYDSITSFFEYLLDSFGPLPNGAFSTAAEPVIRNYINEKVSDYKDLFTINSTVFSISTSQVIRTEVDADRPLMVGINYFETDSEATPHTVVVYGYQTFKINGVNVDGYICDMGWYDTGTNYCWFNGSWLFGGHLTFEVNHTHIDTQLDDSHILQCDECNRCTTTDGHIENEYQTRDAKDNAATYHNAICKCGYVQTKRHKFRYVNNFNGTHDYECEKCYYVARSNEAHTFKYPGHYVRCLYCGGDGLPSSQYNYD